jgi:hypothetical protein
MAFIPMSVKDPPGTFDLHSKSFTMHVNVKKKLSTIAIKAQAQPPFRKFLGRYRIPVQTKPFSNEK